MQNKTYQLKCKELENQYMYLNELNNQFKGKLLMKNNSSHCSNSSSAGGGAGGNNGGKSGKMSAEN